MQAQITVSAEDFKTIEARVRAALHDLGDPDPSKPSKLLNEERDVLQQRVYSSTQCLRQLLNSLVLR